MKPLYIILTVLITFNVLATTSITDPKPPPTATTFGKLPAFELLALSPSGQRLAYRDTRQEQDLLLVREMKTGKMISAASIAGANPNNLFFIDEERIILQATENARLPGFRGRYDFGAAFVLNTQTNRVHQLLIPGKGIYPGQFRLGRIVGISEDKKSAYMPAWQTPRTYSLFKVNLEKPRKPYIYQRGTSDTVNFFLNTRQQVIARERYNNDHDLHSIEARKNNQWVEIFRQETPYTTKGFRGVTPDGNKLVFRAQNADNGRWAYYTLSLSDGTISDPLFSHAYKDVEAMIIGLDQIVHGVRYSGFYPSYEFFDEKLNVRMRSLRRALPNQAIWIRDFSDDWNTLTLYVEGGNNSGQYLIYHQGKLQHIAHTRPDIGPEAVSPVQITDFDARDKHVIPTLLTLPQNVEHTNLPAILMPHGGPESYDRAGFDYMAQYFASQGYVVIQPQFRGSTGFGEAHRQAGRGEWGRKMQHDLTDAVAAFSQQGLINPERVCIVGASYGGYAALAGAVFTPDRYQCAVSINGVSDVEAMLKTDKRDYGTNHWVVAYWSSLLAKGKVNNDHLADISPINHTAAIKTPILLIHGEQDEVVDISQSEAMFSELRAEKKSVQFIRLKKGNHYLSKGKNRVQALEAIAEFVETHL